MITSLPELYFRVRRFVLLVQTKKSDFYELWKQQNQLKIMEMSEVWIDVYINLNLKHTYKIY